MGSNVSVRLPELVGSNDIELGVTSSGKFSEFTVGKVFYALGQKPEQDPSAAFGTQVTRIDDWSVIVSAGAGLVIHSTRTIEFDLPAIVVGLLVYTRASAIYSITQDWAMAISFSGSAAIARDYFNFGVFTGLGPVYRF
jgi:hypothetical protein